VIAHSEGQFVGGEGQLYWQAWQPEAARALLLIVHGFDDHSGRYTHVAEYFSSHGFAVYAFDQIGHGKSGGARGHIDRFDDYVEDLNRFVGLARSKSPGMKAFVYGHSQGGMVALRYGITYPNRVDGIMTSGAALLLAMPAPAWKVGLGRVLASRMPKFAMANGIRLDALTHDERMLELTRSDPLRHGRASARWADEFFKAQRDTLASASRFTTPLLMLHGGVDRIISPEATRQFYASAASRDKQIRIYEDMYHEICNEVGRQQVLADMEQWMNERLSAAPQFVAHDAIHSFPRSGYDLLARNRLQSRRSGCQHGAPGIPAGVSAAGLGRARPGGDLAKPIERRTPGDAQGQRQRT